MEIFQRATILPNEGMSQSLFIKSSGRVGLFETKNTAYLMKSFVYALMPLVINEIGILHRISSKTLYLRGAHLLCAQVDNT